MKRKKGFTLIELLAVIVVLAIIALIATPIVMNTIKNSKKGATERTADNYVDQVETSLMTYKLEYGENLPDGEYIIDSETGNLCLNEVCNELLPVEMNGTKPSGGKVVIKNSGVEKEDSFMFVGDYSAAYNASKKTFEAKELEVLCTKTEGVDLENLQYGYEFTCELGDNDSKTFYVLENNEDIVSLIMNMNIDSNGKGTTSGNTVAWSSDGDNSNGPVTALSYLESSTKNWTKVDSSQISLPSGQQIAKAGGDTAWTDSNYTGTKLSSWLYENLNDSSAPYAYWTSTHYASRSRSAWNVNFFGDLNLDNVYDESSSGIRPVITVSKAQLG